MSETVPVGWALTSLSGADSVLGSTATVNLAACKIAGILFGMPRWQTLLIIGLLNVTFAAHSGLWGALVIDMIQFFIKMTAVIAAAYFAVQHVGGLDPARARYGNPRRAHPPHLHLGATAHQTRGVQPPMD